MLQYFELFYIELLNENKKDKKIILRVCFGFVGQCQSNKFSLIWSWCKCWLEPKIVVNTIDYIRIAIIGSLRVEWYASCYKLYFISMNDWIDIFIFIDTAIVNLYIFLIYVLIHSGIFHYLVQNFTSRSNLIYFNYFNSHRFVFFSFFFCSTLELTSMCDVLLSFIRMSAFHSNLVGENIILPLDIRTMYINIHAAQ